MEVTYNYIIAGDLTAIQLHRVASYNEAFGFDFEPTWVDWELFTNRINYLENICEYAGIKPEPTLES